MAAVDPRKIALVHLQIDASSFEFYHCDKEIVAGVDIGHLHRVVKTINVNDTLNFFIDRHDKSKLGIVLHNAEKQREVRYYLKLLHLTQYTITDIIEYDHYPPEVSSQEFQKICRDMASMGAEVVEIRNVNRQLIFKALGGIAEHEVIVNIVSNDSQVPPPQDVVQGTFLVKFLIAFAKATHLTMSIHIQHPGDKSLLTQSFQSAPNGPNIRIQQIQGQQGQQQEQQQLQGQQVHEHQLQGHQLPAASDLSEADYNYLVNRTKVYEDTTKGYDGDALDALDAAGLGAFNAPDLDAAPGFDVGVSNGVGVGFDPEPYEPNDIPRPEHFETQLDQDPQEVRREKGFLLSQYLTKNKDYRYSSKLLSMDNTLEEIRNEVGFINFKKELENNLGFWKRAVVLSADGIVRLNNTYDPFDVDMSDWSKQIHYDVMETGNYDEVLEELVQKYRNSFALPPEVKLMTMMGMSFGMALMSKQHEKELLKRLQADRQRQEERIRAEVASQLQEQLRQMNKTSFEVEKAPSTFSFPKGPSVSVEQVADLLPPNVSDLVGADLDSDSSGANDDTFDRKDANHSDGNDADGHNPNGDNLDGLNMDGNISDGNNLNDLNAEIPKDIADEKKPAPKKKGRGRAAGTAAKTGKKKMIKLF
ncbi:hypothetical protein HK102_012039 [Quaeritorhiza haematococci]|nr:hypothetical protein HK102_012039 [Quaeritorhiza haematococci]